jgi:hypothetical protein
MGGSRTACRPLGLALDRCASLSGPAVAWLKRGATARTSLDRHATYIVATYIAGAAR